MHEWALAESVIFSTVKFAKEKGMEVKEVVIHLGELQQIDKEVFELALKEIMKSAGLEITFKFKKEKAAFKCKRCGKEWGFGEENLDEREKEAVHFIPETVHTFIKCPECGSADFIIKRGRGVWISIEGE